jgi:hypothetical protein
MDAFQMMHYALLGIRIVCAMTGFQVIVFDIKTFDHTNDNLFKRVTKDTKLNTPEQQLCHSHHTVHMYKTSISKYSEEVNIERF